MRDVTLVPERDVLHPGQRVAAQQARDAGDALGRDRVALVGHRRAALLARTEGLLELSYLRSLQMADLDGEALEARAGERDRVQQLRVAIPRHDLGPHLLAAKAD